MQFDSQALESMEEAAELVDVRRLWRSSARARKALADIIRLLGLGPEGARPLATVATH